MGSIGGGLNYCLSLGPMVLKPHLASVNREHSVKISWRRGSTTLLWREASLNIEFEEVKQGQFNYCFQFLLD